jgi:hypothetical protein
LPRILGIAYVEVRSGTDWRRLAIQLGEVIRQRGRGRRRAPGGKRDAGDCRRVRAQAGPRIVLHGNFLDDGQTQAATFGRCVVAIEALEDQFGLLSVMPMPSSSTSNSTVSGLALTRQVTWPPAAV